MRRFRLITVVLVALLGIWLLWRQFVQRRRVEKPYPSSSSLPEWTSATTPSPSASVTKGLATTAERTHNQSDALAQPQEPPAPTQASEDAPLSEDTNTQRERAVEPDTTSEA